MATKKKARRKKAQTRRRSYPSSRTLSVAQLTAVGACYSSRLAFVQAFRSFGDVVIDRNTVRRLSDDAVRQIGNVPPYFILTWEGRVSLERAMARQGISDHSTDVGQIRRYLEALARAFLRHPRKFA
jgi:hypothetical protein